MKNTFVILALVLILHSCSKNHIVYISHDSDLFVDQDSLLYGKWEYLYTMFDNIGGGYKRIEENRPSLIIKRFDDYEKAFGSILLEKGKIDTVGHLWGYKKVVFCPGGIKDPLAYHQLIRIINIDTLVHCPFIAFDSGFCDYYRRKLD